MRYLSVDGNHANEGLFDFFSEKGEKVVFAKRKSGVRQIKVSAEEISKILERISSGNFKVRDADDLFYIPQSETIFPSKDKASAYDACKSYMANYSKVSNMVVSMQDAFLKTVPALRDCHQKAKSVSKMNEYYPIAESNWSVLKHTVGSVVKGKEHFLGDPFFKTFTVEIDGENIAYIQNRWRLNEDDTLFKPMTRDQCIAIAKEYSDFVRNSRSRIRKNIVGGSFVENYIHNVKTPFNKDGGGSDASCKGHILWNYYNEFNSLERMSRSMLFSDTTFVALLKGSLA